ncbi:MAG: hypothetical protein HZC03_01505 [Candidatus Lloydbacteria bacterium]|nr:hypothetical protein [Candidatus Lloydbacteria bacterium]
MTIAIFFVGIFVHAAGAIPGIGDAEPIIIRLSSDTPEPFEKITARAESVRYDVNRIRIQWLINGKQTSSGIGNTSVTFETGDVGTATNVRMVAEVSPLGIVLQTINVVPASIDLLWQSNVYVPPFYRGKALASSAAELKVVAIPNVFKQGKKIPAKELVYHWKLSDKTLVSQSGYGKDAIIITGARIYGDAEVSVEVSSLDGSIMAKKFLRIPSVDPKLVFYENHPLEGVRYAHALNGEFNLSGKEVVVRAEPYFFSNFSTLNYEWFLNNQTIEVAREKWNDLILRQEGGAGGVSKIDLSVQNGENTRGRILQNAAAALLISFGEQRGAGAGTFFGQ